jgi:cellulose synthase/poly-beta-1,6-N-acetylglucosamine synthase-like glycosyltransferase
MNITLFWAISLLLLIPILYLLIIAAAASLPRRLPPIPMAAPRIRFGIIIPAHNEGAVIATTVTKLLALDYPSGLFTVHVIADHCTDKTAEFARMAGAVVHQRDGGPRGGKGSAMNWGLEQILTTTSTYDAVIVFDADTQVDSSFLRIMNARLCAGAKVVQGQHVISNPNKGLFPALTWAMFIVDNRFQNQGRSNLRWSAKNMGDSICFRADILKKMGWGEGLTEDSQLRCRLLLEGVRIEYEPKAKGFGEATLSWVQARNQRTRWLSGKFDICRQYAWKLLKKGLRSKNCAMLDGAVQAISPSYSTLTLVSLLLLMIALLKTMIARDDLDNGVNIYLAIVVFFLFIYPFWGLALERAPFKAYLAILAGPLFIVWRSWLALNSRLLEKPVHWIRTSHGNPT